MVIQMRLSNYISVMVIFIRKDLCIKKIKHNAFILEGIKSETRLCLPTTTTATTKNQATNHNCIFFLIRWMLSGRRRWYTFFLLLLRTCTVTIGNVIKIGIIYINILHGSSLNSYFLLCDLHAPSFDYCLYANF